MIWFATAVAVLALVLAVLALACIVTLCVWAAGADARLARGLDTERHEQGRAR